MDRLICSIIVLNHNGRDLLAKFMPSILDAVEFDGGAHEIIIVDNASTDGSQEFIQKNFPSVRLIPLSSNRHMDGYNEGIKASRNKIVVLLNNDIRVEQDFIQPLLSHFSKPEVFAARPTINLVQEGAVEDTKGIQIGVQIKLGFIEYLSREAITEEERKCAQPTFCAPGGAGAFDRNKFLELEGFDELFAPFYWEDIDLCYRAWKRGWLIISEPRSVIYHYTHTTIGRSYNRKYIELIALRNRYLLVWKNITDWAYLLQHLAYIPVRLGWSLLNGNLTQFLSFFYALKSLRKAIKKRMLQKKSSRYSDREVISFLRNISKR
jgi:GT2 family glycosyltransferase